MFAPNGGPLAHVVIDAPVAVIVLDLDERTVTYGNLAAATLTRGLELPACLQEWVRAAGLCDEEGRPLAPEESPLAGVAAGRAVTGERVRLADGAGRWVSAGSLSPSERLHRRALVVFLELRDDGEPPIELRDRVVVATELSFTISDPWAPDNPLIWVNPAFTRVTGYQVEEVVGRNCRFLQGPSTDRDAVAELRRALAERRGTTVTLLNYRRDGTAFWNQVSLSPVFDRAGRLTHFVGVQADVTERIRVELEREAAHAAEREARAAAERAREAAEAAQARLALVAETTRLLTATLEVDAALERLAGLVVPTLADWCAIDLVLEDATVRRAAASHRDPAKAPLVLRLADLAPVTLEAARRSRTSCATASPCCWPTCGTACPGRWSGQSSSRWPPSWGRRRRSSSRCGRANGCSARSRSSSAAPAAPTRPTTWRSPATWPGVPRSPSTTHGSTSGSTRWRRR